jgi:hypothetical protein
MCLNSQVSSGHRRVWARTLGLEFCAGQAASPSYPLATIPGFLPGGFRLLQHHLGPTLHGGPPLHHLSRKMRCTSSCTTGLPRAQTVALSTCRKQYTPTLHRQADDPGEEPQQDAQGQCSVLTRGC